MAEREKRDSILRSWKEIAAHLGVDGRTCARWEKKFGLPIHRAQGEVYRSRVFAYRDELDTWFQTTFRNQNGATAAVRPLGSRRTWLWSLPVLAAVILGGWVLIPKKSHGPDASSLAPAGFRIEGSVLVILNNAGRKLWSYDTGLANLMPDKYYMDSEPLYANNTGDPFILFRDLQGDGRPEVLFATQTSDELREGDLICLSDRGDLLWKFHAGREVLFGTKTYSSDYRISWFDASDLEGDGRLEVLLSSIHNPEWPCQLALLSSEGTLLGEYWNAGHIIDAVGADIDSDGRKELIAGGLNNEYRKACLVALDTPEFHGSSPNSSEFRSPDLPPGGEIAYLLLPRTQIDQLEGLYEGPEDVQLLANGNIRVFMHISGLFFEFRPDLTLLQILPSHAFELLHQKYFRAGKVTTPYSEQEYVKPLEKEVLYFDGQGWTTTPTTKLKLAR